MRGTLERPSPVPTAFASVGAFDHSFESSSRSDFMSASGGPASTDQRAG
uniref:Uncharacterized protein n=1 Tax=Meloidogyne floridensis TaxID=298350 RepID=A0A915NSX5_9BILA